MHEERKSVRRCSRRRRVLGGAIGGEEYLEVQKKGVRRYSRRRRVLGG